jgi:hypothetical protein
LSSKMMPRPIRECDLAPAQFTDRFGGSWRLGI